MRFLLVFSFSVLTLSVYLYKYLSVDLIEHCEIEKCPFCFGTDLCELFLNSKINLIENNLIEFISNRVGVKNVFYAELFEKKIILKKLAHTVDLKDFDKTICKNCEFIDYTNEILNVLNRENESISNFKLCSETESILFLQEIISENNLKQVWTILKINAEPLLLKMLHSKWPVPKYLGACGRLVAQTYCGSALNTFEYTDWFSRAYLAYQLLIAAKNFTFDHEKFSFYLTDISPDNIAVDTNLKLSFIDIENVILKLRNKGDVIHRSTHYIDDYDETLFIYSENEICNSGISDHNFYAVCRLLLASDAPWPMMMGGLLHSAPTRIPKELFSNIDLCVNPKGSVTRFAIAESILEMLGEILYEEDFNIIL